MSAGLIRDFVALTRPATLAELDIAEARGVNTDRVLVRVDLFDDRTVVTVDRKLVSPDLDLGAV